MCAIRSATPARLTAATESPPPMIVVPATAATAFATPIGFQTNLMVYGPGGYKYSDFLRLGLPLQALVGISTVTLISLLWL